MKGRGVSFSPLRRTILVEQAISALQTRLRLGDWDVGERLPTEQQLAAQLGVGRSTVREAVRALASMGLVHTRQGAGTFVRAQTIAEPDFARRLASAALMDVYEVRQGLEIQAARLAAARRTDEDVARMHHALSRRRRARQAGRMGAWVDADLDFHRAVVAAAHNPVLSDVFTAFTGALRAALDMLSHDPDLGRDGHDDHVALSAAIAHGDAAAAVAATSRILDTTAEQLAWWVEHGSAEEFLGAAKCQTVS
jgi:GntR family transcriptional regulator, transcriptional repressor for pyruvate dehydrogenase complex